MNSSLMYKFSLKILCLFTVLLLCVVTLCSCSKQCVYRIDSFTWINKTNDGIKVTYTYTESSKPATVTVGYPFDPEEGYTDTFNYNILDSLKSVTRTFNTGGQVTYSADKITNNKYILYDNEKEYLTIIFDHSGFIVSYRYANGYITEYAFSYDENGKPVSMKQLNVTPSGSNKTVDYIARFTDSNTYHLYTFEENGENDEYYEVKFQKIEVKG